MIPRLIFWLIIGAGIYVLWRVVNMKLKHGADLENVSWRMFYAAICMDAIMSKRGAETVITSGADGKHSAKSKHYAENNASGLVEALDFRSRHVTDPYRVVTELKQKLGPDYDVVLESDHIHVEYDPKGAAV